MDYFTTKINFLGVIVTKIGNKLETDLYCKPNDQMIRTGTFMHNHVTVMCIKDLLHTDRFKRICSTEENRNNHLEQLKPWLVKRGCRKDHVDSKIERISLVERIGDKKIDNNITLVSPAKSP